MPEEDVDVITTVEKAVGADTDKVVISSSSGSSSSSSSSSGGVGHATPSSATGGDTYGEEASPYDGYDGYGNYETYYDESTASPDGDTSRRVTITGTGTDGDLDLGAGGAIELDAGTGGKIITSGGGSSITMIGNKTSVG